MKLFLFLSISVVLFLLVYQLLRWKLGIPSREGFYRHVNRVHRWGEVVIFLLSLVCLAILAFFTPMPLKPHYFVLGLCILYCFRAFMEWRVEKDTKEYLLTALGAGFLFYIYVGVELGWFV